MGVPRAAAHHARNSTTSKRRMAAIEAVVEQQLQHARQLQQRWNLRNTPVASV